MENREDIKCPACHKFQCNDIYEYIDTGDMEGFFHLECDFCSKVFEVSFELKSFIKESLM